MSDKADAVQIEKLDGGLKLTLNRAPRNILDAEMIAAVRAAVESHGHSPDLRGIIIGAAGDHFSYGASVEEHRKEQAAEMLEGMHGMIKDILALDVPVIAAVRGLCLGGGLELASTASWIFASESAKLGQPEIKLGVMAPVASVLLPLRVGQARAEGMLASGATVRADRAREIGLVDEIVDDPDAAALSHFEKNLAPLSASSLRFAMRAARAGTRDRTFELLDRLQAFYCDDLMQTHDANEGIEAFIDKRPPTWRNA